MADVKSKVKDPVCGMDIDPEHAVGTREHAGRTFQFCSNGCIQAFDRDPARYAARAGATPGRS